MFGFPVSWRPLGSASSAHLTPQKGQVFPTLESSGTTCLHLPHTFLTPVWPKPVSAKTSRAKHVARNNRFMTVPRVEPSYRSRPAVLENFHKDENRERFFEFPQLLLALRDLHRQFRSQHTLHELDRQALVVGAKNTVASAGIKHHLEILVGSLEGID